MTRETLAELVEAWRKRLIPEWRVVLMDQLPADHPGDCWATCETDTDYTRVRVYFTDDCLQRFPREIEVTVVHELLHPLMRPFRRLLQDARNDLPFGKWSVLSDQENHEEEQLIDRLAYLLVAQTHDAEPFGTIEAEPTPSTTRTG